jgi:hypothetical protein
MDRRPDMVDFSRQLADHERRELLGGDPALTAAVARMIRLCWRGQSQRIDGTVPITRQAIDNQGAKRCPRGHSSCTHRSSSSSVETLLYRPRSVLPPAKLTDTLATASCNQSIGPACLLPSFTTGFPSRHSPSKRLPVSQHRSHG